MSRALRKYNPYDLSVSQIFPIHDHPLYHATDHGQCAGCSEDRSAEFVECPECDIFFHKECIESSPEIINHPFHPQHALYLVKRESLPHTNPDRKCCLCGQELMLLVYSCLICDFKVDMSCAKNPPLPEIDKPRVDKHKLQLLMKNVLFTCDACGLEGDRSPYLCLPCNSMFHIRCVQSTNELGQLINPQETRLDHGSRVLGNWYCGCGSVHSDVACGNIKARALEDIPEEFDYKSMDKVPNVIGHFMHEHRLSRHEDGKVDANTICHICKLPVASTLYYRCMRCDFFFLHERCIMLPLKKRTVLHNHPLILQHALHGSRLDVHKKYYCCSACGQLNDGAKYKCDPGFNLDVGCASITFPFQSAVHIHPLTFKPSDKKKCGVCELWTSPVLYCGQCDFHLGFDCAQLPALARHKYDKHDLILNTTRDHGGDYWCEVCEKKVEKNAIFYTCDESSCCSTFHTHCVAGGLNLELGLLFTLFGHEFTVVENTLAAPRYCCICGLGCKGPKVIKSNQGGDKYLCSSSCLMRNRLLLHNL